MVFCYSVVNCGGSVIFPYLRVVILCASIICKFAKYVRLHILLRVIVIQASFVTKPGLSYAAPRIEFTFFNQLKSEKSNIILVDT
jgi:hypothetical protein